MEFIDDHHSEWIPMWEALALNPINHDDAVCEYHGVHWEYMGSTLDHHHFWHPRHPHTKRAEFIYIERPRATLLWAAS